MKKSLICLLLKATEFIKSKIIFLANMNF